MIIAPTSFGISRWAAWTPDLAGFKNDIDEAEIPNAFKRRVGAVGKKALTAAWNLKAENARIVFSSRHGDFSRSLSLIDSLVKKAEVSPADFTLSVHHALVGLLSIAQKNKLGHTAISSGTESFCLGLVEALACLCQGEDEVLLLHCDDPLPAPFEDFNSPGERKIALALLLKRKGNYTLSASPPVSGQQISTVPALEFVKFLNSAEDEAVCHSQNATWRWSRNAAD